MRSLRYHTNGRSYNEYSKYKYKAVTIGNISGEQLQRIVNNVPFVFVFYVPLNCVYPVCIYLWLDRMVVALGIKSFQLCRIIIKWIVIWDAQ